MKNLLKPALLMGFTLLGASVFSCKPAAGPAQAPAAGQTAQAQTGQAAASPSGGLVAPGATPQLVARQFSFTEGPAPDRKGNVYFTDQPNDKIWKYSTDGKLSVFLDKTGRANGMYFDKAGNLITCSDEKNQLWSISPKGQIKVLLENFQGHRFNGPNDLWINPENGNIYFTDPYYQRPWWTRQSPELAGEKVYFLAKDATGAVVADDQLRKPNGIIGTPDGKYLYVADIGDNKTYRFEIGFRGQLTNRQLFVPQGSDGLTLDEQGNLYLTGKGVTVYNPAGQQIAHIPVPEPWTANVCFGGKGRRTLFITASKAVYTLPMLVKGAQ